MRSALRRVHCLLSGHQEVRCIPHWELCEIPWKLGHKEETRGLFDQVCAHCDSDWL